MQGSCWHTQSRTIKIFKLYKTNFLFALILVPFRSLKACKFSGFVGVTKAAEVGICSRFFQGVVANNCIMLSPQSLWLYPTGVDSMPGENFKLKSQSYLLSEISFLVTRLHILPKPTFAWGSCDSLSRLPCWPDALPFLGSCLEVGGSFWAAPFLLLELHGVMQQPSATQLFSQRVWRRRVLITWTL